MRDAILRAAEAGYFRELAFRYVKTDADSELEADLFREITAKAEALVEGVLDAEDIWFAIYPDKAGLESPYRYPAGDFRVRFAKAVGR